MADTHMTDVAIIVSALIFRIRIEQHIGAGVFQMRYRMRALHKEHFHFASDRSSIAASRCDAIDAHCDSGKRCFTCSN